MHVQRSSALRRPCSALLLGRALPSHAQTAAPAPSTTRAHVETLASDKLEGRMAGSAGERLAADYIARELTRIGAKPLPGQRRLSMPFEFTAGTKDGGSTHHGRRSAGAAPQRFTATDARAGAVVLRQRARSAAPVVFAGYGLVVPESAELRLRQLRRPRREGQDRRSSSATSRRTPIRRRARSSRATRTCATRRMAARQRGAKGDARRHRAALAERRRDVPMTFDTALAGSGIVAASISGDAGAARSSRRPARQLEAVQKELDSRQSARRRLRDSRTSRSRVKAARRSRETADRPQRRRRTCRRRAPTTGVDKPWVALGAHYDHLGRGGARQLARRQGGGRPDSSRRRRQRVGHGRGAGHRRSAGEAAAPAQRAARRSGRPKRSA